MSKNKACEGDLHLIMMAVQKLVDEALPPDELGRRAYTPAILNKLEGIQHTVCKTLGLPKRPLMDDL